VNCAEKLKAKIYLNKTNVMEAKHLNMIKYDCKYVHDIVYYKRGFGQQSWGWFDDKCSLKS